MRGATATSEYDRCWFRTAPKGDGSVPLQHRSSANAADQVSIKRECVLFRQELDWIDQLAVLLDLEVHVGARGATGAADYRDRLARRDGLPDANEVAGIVAVT